VNIVRFEPEAAATGDGPILRSTFRVGRFRCTMTMDTAALSPGAAGVFRVE
jgi:hypothetical protein